MKTKLSTLLPELSEGQIKALHRILVEEIVGEDEEMPNELGFLSDVSDAEENWRADARNKLKTAQVKALNNLFGIDTFPSNEDIKVADKWLRPNKDNSNE